MNGLEHRRQRLLPPFLVKAGWLIDGSGSPVLKDARFAIVAGEYRLVEASAAVGMDIVDLSACTVLPGLIDSHVHLFMSGGNDPAMRRQQLEASFETIGPVIAKHCEEALRFGVAAVRDGGDWAGHVLRWKQAQHAAASRLLIAAAGQAWHAEGRYGRLIGRAPAPGTRLSAAISAESDPIDQVKIVNSGLNSLLEFGRQTAPQFEAAELAGAVAAARRRGLKTMIHANGRLPVRMSIMAGCASVEHGFFMGAENLELMAKHGVIWVPTVGTMFAYTEQLSDFPEKAAVARRNLVHQLEQLALARNIGVKVAVGTDAGSLGVHHGLGVITELKLLLAAGYTIEEAIACSVKHGAELLPPGDFGPLLHGRRCALIAVPGSPQQLPESLHSIRRLGEP